MDILKTTNLKLGLKHIEDLRESGLKDETIGKYEFCSVSRDEATETLGFLAPSAGWIIRYPNSSFVKFKPDLPVNQKQKYLAPKGTSQEVFVTNLAEGAHEDISRPYYFTEGEKKCLALEQAGYATIGIPGVWGWKSKGHLAERITQMNLKGRECYIIFDSDKYFNEHVRKAEEQLAKALDELGAVVKVINLDPSFGKGADDQLQNLSPSEFECYVDNAQEIVSEINHDIPQLPPVPLPEFVRQDIPPVEYYVEGLIQKQGKTMVSAQTNIGKSLFVQNLALTMVTSQATFLDRFTVKAAKVLYLDLEMGRSALFQRLKTLFAGEYENAGDLFVKFIPDADFLEKRFQETIEGWISDFGINVLIIDPLSNAWSGNENDKQEVQRLTSYLNTLIARYGISIVVVHHWRKGTKDFKKGGEMAAGSYKWAAWLDQHITLQGQPGSVTISNEKARNTVKFKPFLARLIPESLRFEFLADFEKKFDEDTAINLFDSFGQARVKVADMCKKAEQEEICSGDTIRNLLTGSSAFAIDKSKKPFYVTRRSEDVLE
jgi:hypothetical protein